MEYSDKFRNKRKKPISVSSRDSFRMNFYSEGLKYYSNHPSNLMFRSKELLVKACQMLVQDLYPNAIFVNQLLRHYNKNTLLHLHSILSGFGLQKRNSFSKKFSEKEIELDKKQALSHYKKGSFISIIHQNFQCPGCFKFVMKGYWIHNCNRNISKLCGECFDKNRHKNCCYFCNLPDPNCEKKETMTTKTTIHQKEIKQEKISQKETEQDENQLEEGEISRLILQSSLSSSSSSLFPIPISPYSSLTIEETFSKENTIQENTTHEHTTHLNLGIVEEAESFEEDEKKTQMNYY
jgi:hypothetical protein